MPHDVFVKITNSCEGLLQEQRKCVKLWRSEINPDYETEVLIGALEDFQAELKVYRDLLTKDLNRTNATSSALANMSKELERLLTLADELTRKGSLPISGGSIVSSLKVSDARWGNWLVSSPYTQTCDRPTCPLNRITRPVKSTSL